jgi:hypothetical protein
MRPLGTNEPAPDAAIAAVTTQWIREARDAGESQDALCLRAVALHGRPLGIDVVVAVAA